MLVPEIMLPIAVPETASTSPVVRPLLICAVAEAIWVSSASEVTVTLASITWAT